jgi:hypothetical protein
VFTTSILWSANARASDRRAMRRAQRHAQHWHATGEGSVRPYPPRGGSDTRSQPLARGPVTASQQTELQGAVPRTLHAHLPARRLNLKCECDTRTCTRTHTTRDHACVARGQRSGGAPAHFSQSDCHAGTRLWSVSRTGGARHPHRRTGTKKHTHTTRTNGRCRGRTMIASGMRFS